MDDLPTENPPVDEARRRRDAEAALADLHPRLLEVERQVLEARARAEVAEVEAAALRAANDQLGARAAQLEVELAAAAVEAIDLADERRARLVAEQEVAAFKASKTFRALRLPRRLYALARGLL